MTLKIGSMDYPDYRSFAGLMQADLPRLGVQPSNRLFRVIGAVYGIRRPGRVFTAVDEAAIQAMQKKGRFDDLPDFVQFLYLRKLIAPRPTGFVPHRPRNLGTRPPWFELVDKARPREEGKAIRHIVPSHLLGYAAEHAAGSIKDDFTDLLDAYADAYSRSFHPIGAVDIDKLFRGVRPTLTLPPAKEWMARRWAWALLYNHPGNLWVGTAEDNEIIGFMYATVYGLLYRLDKVLGAPYAALSPTKPDLRKRRPEDELQEFRKVVSDALRQVIGYKFDNLRDDINEVVLGVATETMDTEVASASDILCFIEDVAANLQLDLPRLGEWDKVQDWREKFTQPGISAAEMCSFLSTDFQGSLAKPAS